MILLTSWFRRRRRARRRQDDSAELGLSLHYDDARGFSDQTPVTPANHAEMLAVAEQHGIADATRPVHDADSLSTGNGRWSSSADWRRGGGSRSPRPTCGSAAPWPTSRA